jgi:hypothetical protein
VWGWEAVRKRLIVSEITLGVGHGFGSALAFAFTSIIHTALLLNEKHGI